MNASSESGRLVLNGMSYAARASAFSNSAMVVRCHTEDYPSAHPLAGLEFQAKIEQKAFEAAGRGWKVPAQNLRVEQEEGRAHASRQLTQRVVVEVHRRCESSRNLALHR